MDILQLAVHKLLLLALYLLLYLLSLAVILLVRYQFHSFFGIPDGFILAIFLFLFCLPPSRLEEKIPGGVCRWARNHSSVIYLTHTAFLFLLGPGLGIWDLSARFWIILALTALLTLLAQKLNWKPLSKLLMVK